VEFVAVLPIVLLFFMTLIWLGRELHSGVIVAISSRVSILERIAVWEIAAASDGFKRPCIEQVNFSGGWNVPFSICED
jgi:hypothetical protein